jgi:hypothetical protein
MVDLHAVRRDAYGRWQDVGARGFAAPVRLNASKRLADTPVQRPLTVVWVKGDGSLEGFTTTNAAGGNVEARLPHFSRWALATR